MTALTIGMAAPNDFDGVCFSLPALRLSQDLDDVVANVDGETTRAFVESWVNAQGRWRFRVLG